MPGIIGQVREIMEGRYELLTAEDYEEAVELVDKQDPDIVLADMYIENEGAFELLKYIRQKKERADIPVLFTGCDISVMSLSKIFSLGASDFVKKPFAENVIFKKMEEHMKLCEIGYKYDK